MIGFALGLAYAHPAIDDRAGASGPCDVEQSLSLARGLAGEHRSEEAKAAVDQAEACGAEPSVVALYRGLVGPADLAALDAAVAANPDHAGLLLSRSRLLASIGRSGEAIADAGRALEGIDRPQPDDVLFLARLQAEGDPVTALDTLDRAIARIGPAPALVDEALTLEMALGWPLAALGRLDGLPRTTTWLDRRATILLLSGSTAEAAEVWEEILTQLDARVTVASRAQAASLRAQLGTP